MFFLMFNCYAFGVEGVFGVLGLGFGCFVGVLMFVYVFFFLVCFLVLVRKVRVWVWMRLFDIFWMGAFDISCFFLAGRCFCLVV